MVAHVTQKEMRMKRIFNLHTLSSHLIAAALVFSFAGAAMAQSKSAAPQATGGPLLLLNEVEADPGDQQNDSCQYVEIRGEAGTTVPANTYFVAIDVDNAFPGRLSHVVAIGGQTVGSNGLIYLRNTAGVVCPNRTPAPGTTVVDYFSAIRIGFGNLEVGAESFAIITTTATISAGIDIDTNDDGVLDIPISNIYDSVSYRIDPDVQYVYPENSAILGAPFQDVPDAFVRFPGNDTPFSAAAFYYGELAASPVETTAFVAPFSANFPTGGVLTPGAPNVPAAVVTEPARADFDGDGRTDLSVFRPSEGNWYLLQSTAGFSVLNWGLSIDVIVAEDFDGDGKTDTAVFRGTDDANSPDFWVLKSSDFTFTGAAWGVAGDIPAVADYDADGEADFAVYRPSNGTWYILPSTTGVPLIVVNPGQIPVPADYDGDGAADGIIYNNGNWVGQLSGGGSVNIPLGQAGDIPVPGDYDGDGKVDQAVFRPADGTWNPILSSTGQQISIQFGANGDIPVPGDYDGDGTEDQAIYRNGQWWVRGSTAGVSVQQFGIATDRPAPAFARP